MQEIKYQPLKNNDDDPVEYENNLDQNSFIYYVRDCKIHRLLKVLLIFFVIVKAIYMINKFEHHNEAYTDYNQTDVLIENTTILYGETSQNTFSDILDNTFKKENYSSNISTTNTINDNITAATVAVNNYLKNNTNPFDADRAKIEGNIGENDYDHADLITTRIIIDSKNDPKTTTTKLKKNNINKTTLETSTTTIYINNKLLQNTETITDLQTSSTTPTKTITEPMMTVKTPAVKSSTADEQKYFLNTSHCHIPFVEPFTPEIRKIFKPQHYTGCTKDQPIVTVSFSEAEGRYILNINYTVAESLKKSIKNTNPIEDDILCCYRQIVRSGSGSNVDASFKLLPCTNFHQDFVVPVHINGIIVNCKSKTEKSTLQEDAFSFVQVNKTLIQQESKNTTNERRKISVLMIGIDTLSRINFRRNMPEMFKYLVNNKWYELMGYNKVGDNTLPNLMPLLSGYTRKTVYDKCHPNKIGGFDNCNFIWTTFKKNGYHTAYAEDSSDITTFSYHLKGFNKPPTDYYFRPMSLAIEKSMKRKIKAGLNYCLGRKQFGEYIYDYATEFVTRCKNLTSFGFFWTNSFSHNSYDVSATMDKTMVKYFKEWEKRGIFENSVVIFFSDHGVRWGPLLKLSQGFLEERLPMFFISVPKWFRETYPQLVKNLEINQRRLTNPFDIYMTLQHILELSESTYNIQQAFDCPKCQSIFKEIPEHRTCDDASIPKAWCTCLPFKTESTKNKIVQTVAKLTIQEMNNYYELKNLTSLCSPLQLKEITNAKLFYPNESKSSSHSYVTTYAIDFVTDPITQPKTLFSATVDYDAQNKRIHLNVEDISRQSIYENTAKCIDDKQAKKYCICRNSLK